MSALSAFLAGLLFGVGLLVSGMADPSKIIGFLDLAGAWDPSIAFVPGGAVLVGALGFRVAQKRAISFFGGMLQLPTRRDIDRPLLLGAVIFGVGWGLAGFCPGPAIVALGAGYDKAVVFVIAVLGGMAVYEIVERFSRRRPARPITE